MSRIFSASFKFFMVLSILRRFSHSDVECGLIIVALFAALANPPDQGVTSPADFEYVQRVVHGDTLMLGTGERLRLIRRRYTRPC